MTIILTDQRIENLDFVNNPDSKPSRMVCGPFDIEPVDIHDEDVGVLEDIFDHGPMFSYYTQEYGTVPQLALAIRYLRYGKIMALVDRSQMRRFCDSYPVARVDVSKQPLDRGVMPACRIRRDIIYIFIDSKGVAEQRDSDALSLMGETIRVQRRGPVVPVHS